jgi:hypothetical protein
MANGARHAVEVQIFGVRYIFLDIKGVTLVIRRINGGDEGVV